MVSSGRKRRGDGGGGRLRNQGPNIAGVLGAPSSRWGLASLCSLRWRGGGVAELVNGNKAYERVGGMSSLAMARRFRINNAGASSA